MRKAVIGAVAVGCLLAPAGASAVASAPKTASAAKTVSGKRTASAAKTTTQTASSGTVTATLSWHGQFPLIKGMRLSISQSGSVVYDQAVTVTGCIPDCGPGASKGESVKVLDLDGNGELEVVLALYSGGAHCCFYDQVYTPSASLGGYVVTQRDFLNSGAALSDLNHNGEIEFVSANNAFAYAFTDFAESGLPIQIFSFSGLAFHDVTRQYPSLIRKDANLWWHGYESDRDSGRVGLIAAWAADEYSLGNGKAASRTLTRQVAEHHITARFVKRLHAFLRRYGYIR